MDYTKEDVINLFAKALSVTADTIKQEFDDLENVEKEDFNSTLEGIATDRFSHVKKTSKERALKQAKRTERAAAEKELAEGLGIDKMVLADQIEHLRERMTGSGDQTNGKKELTKEELAKHPLFSELVQGIKKESAEKEAQIEHLKSEYQKERVQLKVKSSMMRELTKLNANLGDDESTKSKRLEKFQKLLFLDNQFTLDDEGNILIVDEKGEQRYKNDKLDPLTLTDAITDNWLWDFKKEETQPINKRSSNPRENGFNKTNFNYKDDELVNADVLFKDINEAKKAGDTEKAAFLQDKLTNLANSK